MNRDMSSHLDASFSTRGAGQLVNEQVVTMKETRAGNMKPAPQGLSRDGRYTVRRLPSGGGMGRAMARGHGFDQGTAPGMSGAEMLPGMGAFDLTLPGIGTVNWKSVALGAGAGILLWMILAKKRRKSALASALAS